MNFPVEHRNSTISLMKNGKLGGITSIKIGADAFSVRKMNAAIGCTFL
jgi:hypothetical protein